MMQEFPFLLNSHVVLIYHLGGLRPILKKGHDLTCTNYYQMDWEYLSFWYLFEVWQKS